jgi:hypothetical protein
VVVGVGGKAAARPVAPRPRRPGGGVPYVVQEGSHTNLVAGNPPEPPPVAPTAETNTAETPGTAAPVPPAESPAESLVSSRSLDDVILAYLSKGDQRR